jgi:hypothetical protein
MSTNSWFQVDRKGLALLMAGRDKAGILYELVQNAWDTDGGTRVDVCVAKMPGRPVATLSVRDNDPNGFSDLSHAYTLFAESSKKKDASKRGRFNLGEKLVLSLCQLAVVRSTTGTVTFHKDGTMSRSSVGLPEGSEFAAEIRMNATEFDEFVAAFWRLIPPTGCETRLNGDLLLRPKLVTEFSVQLPTVISDAEGVLRPTKRITNVEVFEVAKGDVAGIYEMGIPVVETGDRYHVNIGQKVPLSMDRDNVPPAYLRAVRAAVLNHTANLLSPEDVTEEWVTNALEAREITPEAVIATIESRYGKQRAVYDPSDREANLNVAGMGYNVIPGSAFSKSAWANIRSAGAVLPSGQIAPTPRPYSTDPDAPKAIAIPREEWTHGMREVEDITRWCAQIVQVSPDLSVRFMVLDDTSWVACFGKRRSLDWNVSALGHEWFAKWYEHPTQMLDIILHELAHNETSNHLEHQFHEACTRMGAELTMAAMHGAKMPHYEKICENLDRGVPGPALTFACGPR